jgi:tripartite-type tricarboxylate transporter receptor subunit TctC
MRFQHLTAAILAVLLPLSPAAADEYPTKPVRLVVPFPPGGPADVLARVISQKLSDTLKQQVYIDNRGGAGGTIGSELVARAARDGYTLLFGSTTVLAVSPSLYAQLPYDPLAFAPIGLFASVPLALVANRDIPVNTVAELIQYVKARPGKLFYGSAGNGTQVHFAGAMFKTLAGLDVMHVPYKGGAPAMAGMLAGEFAYEFDVPQTSLPYVRDGRIKMLAITSLKPSPLVPGVPTVAESALPGFEVISWNGLVAPPATPGDITGALNGAIKRILATPEMVDTLARLGASPTYSTPADMGALMTKELTTWRDVARQNNIKAE